MDILRDILPKNLGDFLKKYKLPDIEYKKLMHKTEITDDEFNLIHAYQTHQCIEKLKKDKEDKKLIVPQFILDEIEANHNWIDPWQDSNFKGIDDAIEHLSNVNNYHYEKYGNAYQHGQWLLGWDLDMRERIIQKYRLTTKDEVKEAQDKKDEKEKITKRFG